MSDHKECFLVMDLQKDIETTDDEEMELVWSEGMIGVMPVFDTREHAEAYYDDYSQIVRMEVLPGDSEKEGD